MRFEDLEAWRRARNLVRSVYSACRHTRLGSDFALKDQIRRASVSVMSNVAEGFERAHTVEKIQMYKVARASAAEVRSLLYVIEDQEMAPFGRIQELRRIVEEAGKLITGLIRSTEKYLLRKRVR